MLISKVLSPVLAPLLQTQPSPAPTPAAAPTPAPSPAPTAAPAPSAGPAQGSVSSPSASPPASATANAPPAPNPAYSGVQNDVHPRADKIRTIRLETADATALSQATAELTIAAPVATETALDEEPTQIGALVAQTRADIIANASQALRAQATVAPQNVAELLSG